MNNKKEMKSLSTEEMLELKDFLTNLPISNDTKELSLETNNRELMNKLEMLHEKVIYGNCFKVYYDVPNILGSSGIEYRDWTYTIAILLLDYKNQKAVVYRIRYNRYLGLF